MCKDRRKDQAADHRQMLLAFETVLDRRSPGHAPEMVDGWNGREREHAQHASAEPDEAAFDDKCRTDEQNDDHQAGDPSGWLEPISVHHFGGRREVKQESYACKPVHKGDRHPAGDQKPVPVKDIVDIALDVGCDCAGFTGDLHDVASEIVRLTTASSAKRNNSGPLERSTYEAGELESP